MKAIVFAHGASHTGHEHLIRQLEIEFIKKGYRLRILNGGFKTLESGSWKTQEFRSGVTPVRAGAGEVDARKVKQQIKRLHGDLLIVLADRVGVETALAIDPGKPMIIIPTSIDGDFKHNIPYGLGFDTAAEEAARQISSLLQAKAGVWYDKTLAVIIRVMGGASGTAHAERVWEAFTELHGPTSHIALTPPFPVNAAPNLRDTASEVLSLLKRHSGKAAVGLLLPDAPCDSIEAGSRSGGAKGQVILTNLLRTDSKPEFVFSDAAEIRTGVLGVPLNTRDSQMASAIVHSIITENGPGRGVRIWYDGQGFVSC